MSFDTADKKLKDRISTILDENGVNTPANEERVFNECKYLRSELMNEMASTVIKHDSDKRYKKGEIIGLLGRVRNGVRNLWDKIAFKLGKHDELKERSLAELENKDKIAVDDGKIARMVGRILAEKNEGRDIKYNDPRLEALVTVNKETSELYKNAVTWPNKIESIRVRQIAQGLLALGSVVSIYTLRKAGYLVGLGGVLVGMSAGALNAQIQAKQFEVKQWDRRFEAQMDFGPDVAGNDLRAKLENYLKSNNYSTEEKKRKLATLGATIHNVLTNKEFIKRKWGLVANKQVDLDYMVELQSHVDNFGKKIDTNYRSFVDNEAVKNTGSKATWDHLKTMGKSAAIGGFIGGMFELAASHHMASANDVNDNTPVVDSSKRLAHNVIHSPHNQGFFVSNVDQSNDLSGTFGNGHGIGMGVPDNLEHGFGAPVDPNNHQDAADWWSKLDKSEYSNKFSADDDSLFADYKQSKFDLDNNNHYFSDNYKFDDADKYAELTKNHDANVVDHNDLRHHDMAPDSKSVASHDYGVKDTSAETLQAYKDELAKIQQEIPLHPEIIKAWQDNPHTFHLEGQNIQVFYKQCLDKGLDRNCLFDASKPENWARIQHVANILKNQDDISHLEQFTKEVINKSADATHFDYDNTFSGEYSSLKQPSLTGISKSDLAKVVKFAQSEDISKMKAAMMALDHHNVNLDEALHHAGLDQDSIDRLKDSYGLTDTDGKLIPDVERRVDIAKELAAKAQSTIPARSPAPESWWGWLWNPDKPIGDNAPLTNYVNYNEVVNTGLKVGGGLLAGRYVVIPVIGGAIGLGGRAIGGIRNWWNRRRQPAGAPPVNLGGAYGPAGAPPVNPGGAPPVNPGGAPPVNPGP
ncbi:MAG: hypothetical protein WC570_00575 [Patescibacteria group bacterium]